MPGRGVVARRVACAVASMILVLAACDGSPTPHPTTSRPVYSPRPNVVFVLTDDLSMNLVQYMPHVLALQRAGKTFSNYTVTDSLCCPSRSSIFTGEFPHNTHVFTNNVPDGGMVVFHDHGDEKDSFAPALQRAGYRTALMGKYLNGYGVGVRVDGLPEDYVPPGWSNWDVGAAAYKEFDYALNEDHEVVGYGHDPDDYLTNVIAAKGQQFIRSSVAARKPFLLELATYAPHDPYTPDPRDAKSFPGLKAPRGPSFNRIPAHAPKWMTLLKKLHAPQLARIDTVFRKRVQAVQSVDRAIASLEATLRASGQLANTVFVFNSDNGYHLGEHGLREGKKTAFDTDVHVPLIMSGPGIAAGSVDDHVVQNIDLAPTFEQLAGVRVPERVDGRSLVPLLHGQSVDWRTIAAVEHHGSDTTTGTPAAGGSGNAQPDLTHYDPDAQPVGSGNPPTYVALRGATWTYVRYVDGTREYYDRTTDPNELDNIAGTLSAARVAELDRTVAAISTCHGGTSCWAAAQPRRS